MSYRLTVTIFTLLIFLISTSDLSAQNCCDIDGDVDLCYLSGATYCGSNTGSCFDYSLDGAWMINALTAKLMSASNFGENGTVDCMLELKELVDVSSVAAINDCGCDIIFLPNVFIEPGTNIQDLSQSFIPDEILQNVYDWSLLCDNNLVIASQGEANTWGYTTTDSNVNPNTPVAGTSLNSIFEGPFGTVDFFNQGGTFQGVFTGTPASGFEVLSHDANNNPTVVLDLASNDILVGDIGIFCSGGAGVVSAGTGVNNNNDILVCNMFGLACQLAEEGNYVTVTHELCPGESIFLPDGQEVNTPGIYLDTLVAFNGCDSIITTSLAYGIDESAIFIEPDTTICQGDTISIDGTSPINIPIPFFENTTDYLIDPPFVNIVSEVPISGFGNMLLEAGMIQSICIEIDHIWLDDIDVILVAPNGEFLDLTTDNGFNNANYTGTCFTETATAIIGSPGTAAPFTGDFLPEGDWNSIYGTPINGVWQLIVKDDANGFTGTLLNWNITFAPLLELSYQWEIPTGLSCIDCPVAMAFPEQSTTYYLTITDSYGCSTLDSTAIAVTPVLPAPDVSCDSITPSSMNINWDAIAGADGYQININNGDWLMPNNGDIAHILNGLSPLDTIEIMVQAFDECNGMTTTLVCSTPDCDAPIPTLDAVSPVSCFGADDGMLTVSASGGSGSGYSFELNGEINTTGTFDNLAAGNYQLIVADGTGCDIGFMVEVPSPDSIILTPLIEQEISCFGATDGSLTVEVEGGIAPFTFVWNNTPGDSILTNVGQGTYELVLTDANGCTAAQTIVLAEPPLLSGQVDSSAVDCFGNTTGTATILPAGGTPTYTYQWDANANSQITSTAVDLPAGTYFVTVTDANNCTFVESATVLEPMELVATISFEDPNCFSIADGSIMVTTSGGTPNYNYEWSNNTLPDAPAVSNLAAGNYTLTITDGNGCTTTASAILEDPAPIELSVQETDATCFGEANGSITVAVLAGAIGTPTYNWDNGNTTAVNTNLSAAAYCVTVSDENNCEAIACAQVSEPAELVANLLPEPVSCDEDNDGAIDLVATGGTAPYQFNWSNGSEVEDLTNLVVGTYLVTVTDANNCMTTANTEIGESSALFTLSFSPDAVDCFGGSTGAVDLEIIGAANTLTYQWMGPNNFQSLEQDIEGIPAGTYQLVVEDANGCEVAGEVTVTEPAAIAATYDIYDVSCFGFSDGAIVIEAQGGNAPYYYSLDGSQEFIASPVFSQLPAGDYSLAVQDANGCTYVEELSIIQPAEIILTLEPLAEIVLGESYTFNLETNVLDSEIDTVIWSPTDSLACPTCLSTVARPLYTTFYEVELINADGCAAKAYTRLIVDRRINVYVPNAFSPNGDGMNDVLMVYAGETNISEIRTFKIFDRWGEYVFEEDNFQPNDSSVSWDGTLNGKLLSPGAFVWMLEVELSDGEIVQMMGDVVLVR